MIAVVDYGLGNVMAFVNIYQRLGIDVCAAKKPEEIRESSKIILPGVGAFDWAMDRLGYSGLRDELDKQVLIEKKPILGICVGMQIMSNRSEEGELPGLGWVNSEVIKFYHAGSTLRLPHMGWNNAFIPSVNVLFAGMADPSFYFLHSYYIQLVDESNAIANSNYGFDFTSAFQFENVYGVQFHPEKSHSWGVQLLKNFSEFA